MRCLCFLCSFFIYQSLQYPHDFSFGPLFPQPVGTLQLAKTYYKKISKSTMVKQGLKKHTTKRGKTIGNHCFQNINIKSYFFLFSKRYSSK